MSLDLGNAYVDLIDLALNALLDAVEHLETLSVGSRVRVAQLLSLSLVLLVASLVLLEAFLELLKLGSLLRIVDGLAGGLVKVL